MAFRNSRSENYTKLYGINMVIWLAFRCHCRIVSITLEIWIGARKVYVIYRRHDESNVSRFRFARNKFINLNVANNFSSVDTMVRKHLRNIPKTNSDDSLVAIEINFHIFTL